jgi:hypothetical protein
MTYSTVLDKYRAHLDEWTYAGQDWTPFDRLPLSRSATFGRAFDLFRRSGGRAIVELGTIRSYTHGGHPACNTDDRSSWKPDNLANWDWGAGCFSRVAAECLADLSPSIVTVDAAATHLDRCRLITASFARLFSYVHADSCEFLRGYDGSIDLLYLDTGDMTPIEPTADLQLAEARIVLERELVPVGGLILIDDVRNQTPRAFGEQSDLGKAKYSLPLLLRHGFRIEMSGYQVLLMREA